jgi:TolB-like protein
VVVERRYSEEETFVRLFNHPELSSISEMFTTEVANSEAFKIIERDQLKKVLDEIAVGQSGIIDTSDARQLGKILGADAIITGSVMKIEEELRIDSRMIEVKTGVIMSAERKICKEILSDISSKVIEITNSLSEKFYQKNTAE